MGAYSSYYLYQKYEKRQSESSWVPCYPNAYSLSGDSSSPLPLVLKEENDIACGYNPCQPMERWTEIPQNEDWECGDCEVGYEFRYVSCEIPMYTYIRDFKYEILCEQKRAIGESEWQYTSRTKIAETPIEMVEKKIKIVMKNGDVFAQSCGDDYGNWYSYPMYNIGSISTPQKTTNVKYDGEKWQEYALIGGDRVTGTSSITFNECVYEIGERFVPNSINNTDRPTKGNFGYNITFYDWDLEVVNFSDMLKWIGHNAFEYNNFKSITFPSSLETIGLLRGWDKIGAATYDYMVSEAFAHNYRLTEINFNEGLTSIGRSDFSYCTALERVEFPSTLERLGRTVFSGCSLMKQIIFKTETPPNAISARDENLMNFGLSGQTDVIVYVPCGSEQAYANWIEDVPSERIVGYSGNCASIPTIDSVYKPMVTYKQGNTTHTLYKGTDTSQVETVDGFAVAHLGYIDELTIHSGVSLSNCTIPNARKMIIDTNELVFQVNEYNTGGTTQVPTGYYNVYDSLEELVVNANPNFSGYSFNGSNSLTSLTFSSACTSTIRGNFGYCQGLKTLTINSNIGLEYDAFEACYNLTDVYITYSGGVIHTESSIDHYPFKDCKPIVHVPCELYSAYISNSFWSTMNIVRDSDDCE